MDLSVIIIDGVKHYLLKYKSNIDLLSLYTLPDTVLSYTVEVINGVYYYQFISKTNKVRLSNGTTLLTLTFRDKSTEIVHKKKPVITSIIIPTTDTSGNILQEDSVTHNKILPIGSTVNFNGNTIGGPATISPSGSLLLSTGSTFNGLTVEDNTDFVVNSNGSATLGPNTIVKAGTDNNNNSITGPATILPDHTFLLGDGSKVGINITFTASNGSTVDPTTGVVTLPNSNSTITVQYDGTRNLRALIDIIISGPITILPGGIIMLGNGCKVGDYIIISSNNAATIDSITGIVTIPSGSSVSLNGDIIEGPITLDNNVILEPEYTIITTPDITNINTTGKSKVTFKIKGTDNPYGGLAGSGGVSYTIDSVNEIYCYIGGGGNGGDSEIGSEDGSHGVAVIINDDNMYKVLCVAGGGGGRNGGNGGGGGGGGGGGISGGNGVNGDSVSGNEPTVGGHGGNGTSGIGGNSGSINGGDGGSGIFISGGPGTDGANGSSSVIINNILTTVESLVDGIDGVTAATTINGVFNYTSEHLSVYDPIVITNNLTLPGPYLAYLLE